MGPGMKVSWAHSSEGQAMPTIPDFWAHHADELANCRKASLPTLVRHLLERYHRPGMAALARLEQLGVEAAQEDGDRFPVLREVRDEIFRAAMELRAHFQKEEREVFPPLLAEACGELPVSGLVRAELLEEEHRAAEALLQNLRQLTGQFVTPAGAGEAYAKFMDELRDFAGELTRHLYLETHLVFRRVPGVSF